MNIFWFNQFGFLEDFIYFYFMCLSVLSYVYVHMCMHTSVYAACMADVHKGQKKALESLKLQLSKDNCEAVHEWWKLSRGLLQEVQTLLTAESPL